MKYALTFQQTDQFRKAFMLGDNELSQIHMAVAFNAGDMYKELFTYGLLDVNALRKKTDAFFKAILEEQKATIELNAVDFKKMFDVTAKIGEILELSLVAMEEKTVENGKIAHIPVEHGALEARPQNGVAYLYKNGKRILLKASD